MYSRLLLPKQRHQAWRAEQELAILSLDEYAIYGEASLERHRL